MGKAKFFNAMLTCFVAWGGLAVASPSSAASTVQSQDFSFSTEASTSGPFQRDFDHNPFYAYYSVTEVGSTSVSFAGFDTSLGTLTGFRLVLDGQQRLTGALRAPVISGSSTISHQQASQSTSLNVGAYALTTSQIATDPIDCPEMLVECFSLRSTNGSVIYDQISAASGDFGLSTFQIVNRVTTNGYVAGFGLFDEGTIYTAATARVEGNLSLTYFYDPFDPGPAVPEPSMWIVLTSGFAAIGAALRRRPLERSRATR